MFDDTQLSFALAASFIEKNNFVELSWGIEFSIPCFIQFDFPPGQGQMLCYVTFFVSIKWETDICELFLFVVLIEVILV